MNFINLFPGKNIIYKTRRFFAEIHRVLDGDRRGVRGEEDRFLHARVRLDSRSIQTALLGGLRCFSFDLPAPLLFLCMFQKFYKGEKLILFVNPFCFLSINL